MSAEITKCSNPFEVGKPIYVSTKEQLVKWMDKLSRRAGTPLRHELNDDGEIQLFKVKVDKNSGVETRIANTTELL